MRARELLFESRIDFVLRTMAPKLARFLADHPDQGSPESLVNKLSWFDPSQGQKYLPWIARIVLDGSTKLEDAYKLRNYLASFDRLKNQLERKDINSYRSAADLYGAIKDRVPAISGKADKRAETAEYFRSGEAELVHRDAQLQILSPKTKKAACYFGRGTQWCTAATQSHNAFDTYNKTGSLYIINVLGAKDHRYQLHFTSGQFMDIHDQPAEWQAFLAAYPQLKSVFASQLAWLEGPAIRDLERAIENELNRVSHSGRYDDEDEPDDRDRDDFLESEEVSEAADPINLMDREDQHYLLVEYPELIEKIQFPTLAQQRMVMGKDTAHFKRIARPDDSYLEAILQNPRTYELHADQVDHLVRNMAPAERDAVYAAVLKHHPKIYWSLKNRESVAELFFKNGGDLRNGYNITQRELKLASLYSKSLFSDLSNKYDKLEYYGYLTDDDLVNAARNSRHADMAQIPSERLSNALIARLVDAAPDRVTAGLMRKYEGNGQPLIAKHVEENPQIVLAIDSRDITPGMFADLMKSRRGVDVALRVNAPASAFNKTSLIDFIEANPNAPWERHLENIPGLADDADVRAAITKALEIDAAYRKEKESERNRWILTRNGWELKD